MNKITSLLFRCMFVVTCALFASVQAKSVQLILTKGQCKQLQEVYKINPFLGFDYQKRVLFYLTRDGCVAPLDKALSNSLVRQVTAICELWANSTIRIEKENYSFVLHVQQESCCSMCCSLCLGTGYMLVGCALCLWCMSFLVPQEIQ